MSKSLKKVLGKLHLWLGIIFAPLVFFVCLTGTIIVFSDEIIELSAGKARYVKEVKSERIPTEQLIEKLEKTFPERRTPTYIVTYRDPERSVRFNSYDPEKGLRMVYVDPYTGEILKDDSTIYFFYITAHLHNSLLLHKTGSWIVDIAVIIFLIELLIGLILWWPKDWKPVSRKAVFTVKWSAPFKRVNFDFHRVFGFYGLAIALVLTLTGLIIAFKPLDTFTKNVFGGNAAVELEKILPKNDTTRMAFPINEAIEAAYSLYPEKQEVQLYTYRLKQSGYYTLNVAKRIGLKSAEANEFLVVDKYTGDKIVLPEEGEMNEKIENLYWAFHMGNWMGWISKLITFFGGVIATLLPVTGIIIWWHKSRNRRPLF